VFRLSTVDMSIAVLYCLHSSALLFVAKQICVTSDDLVSAAS